MSKLTIQRDVSGIKGLCVITPRVFYDKRGYFTETYNETEFNEEGLLLRFVQDNEVHSQKGVLRGMHVNVHHPQGKLIRVLYGKIFDVVIDLRKDSSTYKQWYGIELSRENKKQLYIPEGMGHGYLAVTDADVFFKVTTYYIPNDERGFAWNSREFDIDWPLMNKNPILSESDKKSSDFAKIDFGRL